MQCRFTRLSTFTVVHSLTLILLMAMTADLDIVLWRSIEKNKDYHISLL